MITIVQPVSTVQGGHGYLVYQVNHATDFLGGKARFIRRDQFTPSLASILGPYTLLECLSVPMSEWHRLCRMPGVGE